MNITITPGKLTGTVLVPGSKSHAHRLMIATVLSRLAAGEDADLSPMDLDLGLDAPSEDLLATRGALATLLTSLRASLGETLSLDCRESGSTLRFLLPVAMALSPEDAEVAFLGTGRLPDRPLSPLWEQMEEHGCRLERPDGDAGSVGDQDRRLICRASGHLSGGDFFLPGDVSSQYVTGLLFALPLTEEGGIIHLTSPLESAGYVDMTLAVLEQFGIEATWEVPSEADAGGRFVIPGGQPYQMRLRDDSSNPAPATLRPEKDWSAAAFWLVANALGSDIQVEGLAEDSVQGDRAILSLIDQVGASLQASAGSTSRTIDVRQIPDLVPILSVLLAVTPGRHQLTGGARLRIKESDRLSAMATELNKLGASVEEQEDGLIFHNEAGEGNGSLLSLKGDTTVSGHNDHRIVMALAIAATVCRESITITDAQAVAKSYPNFWEDYQMLGGQIQTEEDLS